MVIILYVQKVDTKNSCWEMGWMDEGGEFHIVLPLITWKQKVMWKGVVGIYSILEALHVAVICHLVIPVFM